jgi:hypothetical protein
VADDDPPATGSCTATIQGTYGATCTLVSVACWSGSTGVVRYRVGPSRGRCVLTVNFADRWGATGTTAVESLVCVP